MLARTYRLIVVCLVAAFICGATARADNGNIDIVGKWVIDLPPVVLTFKDDGTFTDERALGTGKGTWKINSGKLEVKYTAFGLTVNQSMGYDVKKAFGKTTLTFEKDKVFGNLDFTLQK